MSNDRLENEIAMLEGRKQNTLKLALDEAAASADKLGAALEKDVASLYKLLHEEAPNILEKVGQSGVGVADIVKLFSDSVTTGGGITAGGFVSPRQAYTVGENGPETLVGASGRIMSNADSRSAFGGSGSTHYYTIDARGTDPVLTEQRTRAAIMAAHNSAVGTSVQVSQDRLRRTPSSS